jgi:hypothetical protein
MESMDAVSPAEAEELHGLAAARASSSEDPSPPLREARAREAASGDANRFFALELSGAVGGEPLATNDPQIWARMGLFLGQELPSPFYLVRDGALRPFVVKAGPDGKIPDIPRSWPQGAGPRGDPSLPSYRLVLEAKATTGSPLTFYGERIASAYQCRIGCRLERRGRQGFQLVEQLAVEERIVNSVEPAGEAQCLRQVTDAALEKLLERLKVLPLFGAPPPALNGTKAATGAARPAKGRRSPFETPSGCL